MHEENIFNLRFHHFGLAVKKTEKAISFLGNLGYSMGEKIYDELQNVNLIMCSHKDMPDVEIIYPAKYPGPLEKILRDSPEIIYHLCYVCDRLEYSLAQIRKLHRVIEVSHPKPAILFDGKNVSFYYIQGFGIIEIIEDRG
jgi:methylmalonyl-CoA/ethylmalonyl-CoA epimerase